MRLFVGNHLQAVFDGAQQAVAAAEIVAGGRVDPSGLGKSGEHVERAPAAELRIAAACDELLRLNEELDLADAAAAELDVVAGNRDLLVAAMIVDLAFDRMDVGDGRVIEIFPPDDTASIRRGRLPRRHGRRRPDGP